MTTLLYRGNDKGEILDAAGQVIGRVVPPEPTQEMLHAAMVSANRNNFVGWAGNAYTAMLSAAPVDLSAAAVRVPERKTYTKFTHGRVIDGCNGWNDCLDAVGVKP